MRSVARATLCALCVAGCGAPQSHGATAPLGAPRVTAGDLDAAVLLGDVPSRASAAGAGPVSLVASGALAEGERIGAFVDVPADACLLAYARASSSLDDADLVIFADEGNPVAADEAPDPHPTVMLCPPHPNRVYLAAHAVSGEGLLALAAQLVRRDKAAAVAQQVGARGGGSGGPRAAEGWPGLDETVLAHRAAIGGKWEETRRVAIPVDARAASAVPVSIEANECLDVLVVPDDGVALLDVDVSDRDGLSIARSAGGLRDRSSVLCSAAPFRGTVLVRPHVGTGLAAVVISHAPLEAAPDLAARPDTVWYATTRTVEQAREALDTELVREGYAQGALVATGSLALGKRATVAVLGSAGACTRVDVVAGAPLALLDAHLWDEHGALAASGSGASQVVLFACSSAKLQLDIEARGRPGPFGVVTRKEKWQSARLVARPLAGSRMLARSVDGALGTARGTAGEVRAHALDAAHRVAWEASVPADTCAVVSAGAEGQGSGVLLRAADASTGDELDRSLGATSARVRTCAGASPRKVRYELTVSAGKLDVLVGQRLHPAER